MNDDTSNLMNNTQNQKCKTEGCATTLSEGSPEICPRCQDDTGTWHADPLLHTQSVVDEAARLRRDLRETNELLQIVINERNALGRENTKLQVRLDHYHSCADVAEELSKENALLREAAQAVVDRWETPLWKDVEPTAAVIYRLRDILSNDPHQARRKELAG